MKVDSSDKEIEQETITMAFSGTKVQACSQDLVDVEWVDLKVHLMALVRR